MTRPISFTIPTVEEEDPDEGQGPPSEAAEEEKRLNQKTVAILRGYLLPDDNPDRIPAKKAAKDILSMLPERSATPGGRSCELFNLWYILMELGERVPHDHVFHLKLARLVILIKQSPKAAGGWTESDGQKITASLNAFHEVLRDNYNPAYDDENPDPEEWTPQAAQRWINTNAFWAALHAQGEYSLTFLQWTMRKAFQSTPMTDYPAMDCHVSAAAQWILIAGQTLLHDCASPDETYESTPTAPRPNMFQWGRWREGFRLAEAEEHMSDESRGLARRAGMIMDVLRECALGGSDD